MMRKATLGILAVCLASCGDNEGDGESRSGASFTVRDSAGVAIIENHVPIWTDADAWRVEDEPLFVLRAFDEGDENRLLDPASVDVDSRGRIIIGDGNQAGWHAVLVYDSLGRFQFQAGREGRGPGEFNQLWWASSYRGDSIVAFDMGGDRLNMFSPNGEFVRTFRSPQLQVEIGPEGTFGYTAGADAAYEDGHFLAYPMGALDVSDGPGPAWYKHLLFRLSPDGESWDTLGTFEISQQYWSGTRQEQLWFGAIAVTAVTATDLYFGQGESFEVRRYDETGRLTRIIRRTHTPRPVTDELLEKLGEWYLDRMRSLPGMNAPMLERIRRDFESGYFAEALPPYSAILLDDLGNLWVEEYRGPVPNERAPVPGPSNWSVFDPDGTWLGNVEMPAGFILRVITHDRVLGFMIDEFDVKEVYVYSLHSH